MKNISVVLLAGIATLGLAVSAQAAMNHQPHSFKTFMGKTRQVMPVDQLMPAPLGGAKVKVKPFYKKAER